MRSFLRQDDKFAGRFVGWFVIKVPESFLLRRIFLRNFRVPGEFQFYKNDFESLMRSFFRQDDKFASKVCGYSLWRIFKRSLGGWKNRTL